MRKKYLHEMPFTNFVDEKALIKWAENSADMDFLGLTPEILLDDKLMYKWFENIFTNFEEFINSKGEETCLEVFEKLEMECPEFKDIEFDIEFLMNIIKRVSSYQPTLDLMQKDNLSRGITIQQLEHNSKEFGVKTTNKLAQITENYNLKEKI